MFSVEHNDGTNAYHFDEEKKEGHEYREEDMEDLSLWEPRLEQRVRETKRVLDYVFHHPQDISNDLVLDLEKVIICGHGFGGCTALAVCREEIQRTSHCIMLDPWLFAVHKHIIDNRYRIE